MCEYDTLHWYTSVWMSHKKDYYHFVYIYTWCLVKVCERRGAGSGFRLCLNFLFTDTPKISFPWLVKTELFSHTRSISLNPGYLSLSFRIQFLSPWHFSSAVLSLFVFLFYSLYSPVIYSLSLSPPYTLLSFISSRRAKSVHSISESFMRVGVACTLIWLNGCCCGGAVMVYNSWCAILNCFALLCCVVVPCDVILCMYSSVLFWCMCVVWGGEVYS